MASSDFKKISVYKKAFDLSMEIFHTSKKFPKEETYSLTDQIRRSSRSVCANLGEAYRKIQYPAHFVSKISDSDMENSETQVWLDYAKACDYITEDTHQDFIIKREEVGKLLNHMIKYPEKY